MFYDLTGNGTHRPLCGLVGTELVVFTRYEVPKVRRLVSSMPAGSWPYTLGMSAISDDAAATSRLLYKVDITMFLSSSDVKATPSFCYYL